jgi:hypothetical protein
MRSFGKTALVAGILGVLLAACGGTSATNPSGLPTTGSIPSTSSTATPAPTPTPTPVASLQSLWCGLSLGQSETAINAVMGPSNPDIDLAVNQIIAAFGSSVPAGETAEGWMASNGDSLLATFDSSGSAVNLQAYSSVSLTQPATDLTCQAFRNNS